MRTDVLFIFVLREASGPRVKLAGGKSALTLLPLSTRPATPHTPRPPPPPPPPPL